VLLACSTASFPQDRLEIAVAKVSWAGYESLELDFPGEDLPPEEELQERLRANDLELAAIRAGAMPPRRDEEGLAELVRIGRAAALARVLDCGIVIVEAPDAGRLPDLAQFLRMLDKALEEVAVDICVVNRCGTLLAEREPLLDLWVQDLPKRIGLALDPAQALLAGWDPLDLEALPAQPRHVYLNDAANGRVVPPGEGDLHPARFGDTLRRQGYEGAVSLVLENADPWAVEPIVRELREAAADWFSCPA
jgi:sugar phosphate isomerase/epimerase